jgi:hypothetical protein
MSDFDIRQTQAWDIDNLCALIFEHGPNPLNYLPRDHLQAIADGAVQAVSAERDGELLGFVSYQLSRHFERYQAEARRPHGSRRTTVCHVQVHRHRLVCTAHPT